MNPLFLRNSALPVIRNFFSERNLCEVISPVLTKSGGIEPYVDAIQIDSRFFLPTSPEISLKKSMAMTPPDFAGVYEIAHAFRDDHQDHTHLREFTMVEWYCRQTLIDDLALEVTELMNELSTHHGLSPRFSGEKSIMITAAELLYRKFGSYPESSWQPENYLSLSDSAELKTLKNLPEDETGRELALLQIFTLLYDSALADFEKSFDGVLFIRDYPPFLRGMASLSENGWAMRLEAVYQGLELCSGYQESDSASDLQDLWNKNNQLRERLGKPAHPVDNQMLALAPAMKGVSGMALGLERTLMCIHGIRDIREFQLDPY